jgi:glycosyltransferase involved in cell wall biosynthesis
MRPRLAIVLSHPTQYYSPWFRWLAVQEGLLLKVFYLWDAGITPTRDPRFGKVFAWDMDLLSGYEHEFVPNLSRNPGTDHFGGLVNPSLCSRLAAWRPDAVLLFGYRYASHLALMAWASARGLPLLFRGDSHFLGRPHQPRLRQALLRALYSRFAAITYVGKANRDYFRVLGSPPEQLLFAPHAVNEAHFDPSSPEHQEASKALRRQLGLKDGQRVLLFAGKLYGHKNPLGLLEAFLALNPPGWALLYVGEGEDKSLLQERTAQAGNPRVHFLPFANQSEMPSRYLAADVFCLPSVSLYETWGLAVNEAMHMGLPCLVSDRVGCQRDLVEDGRTGWVFRATDPEHLRAKLGEVFASDPVPLGRRAAQLIRSYTYRQASQGLLAALDKVTRDRLPGSSGLI